MLRNSAYELIKMQNMQKIIAAQSWGLYDQIRFLRNIGLHNEVPSQAGQNGCYPKVYKQ